LLKFQRNVLKNAEGHRPSKIIIIGNIIVGGNEEARMCKNVRM